MPTQPQNRVPHVSLLRRGWSWNQSLSAPSKTRLPHPQRRPCRRLGWAIALTAIALAFAESVSCQSKAKGTLEHPFLISVCDLREHPTRYSGRFVRFRATFHSYIHGTWYSGNGCEAYPEQAGPDSPGVHVHFRLQTDQEWWKYFTTPQLGANPRNDVDLYLLTMTYTGLVQVAKKGKPGFGNMNLCRTRLVLRSVADVQSQLVQRADAQQPKVWLPMSSPLPPLLAVKNDVQ